MPAAVEIEGLTKVYGGGHEQVTAIDSLSLTVSPGEVFGFLGPNGAGKTSTVQVLMGIIYPTSGSVRLFGKDARDAESRAVVGYLPEQFNFHSFLRAHEFLDFHARLYGMPAGDRAQRVREVLELVGLSENSRSRIRTFSQGMMQRLGIAQAIINHPQLLILDEPTSALDPMGRRDVRELLSEMRSRGTAIFLNSHMLSEVEMVCDRVGIMNEGRLIRTARLEEFNRPKLLVDVRVENLVPQAEAAIRSLACAVECSDDSRMTVELEKEDHVNELAEIIMQSGATLKEFTPRQQTLEDVFIEVIEGSSA